MHSTESKPGRFALMVGHCAGMVDLVALPVWVGTLIALYRFDPQMSGMLVTLFLLGAFTASVSLAPNFNAIRPKTVAVFGFGIASVAFGAASASQSFMALAVAHLMAGIFAGIALSVTHGTIARSANPHRQFALVGLALGVFGIVFLGSVPALIAMGGRSMLFLSFALVMGVATIVSLWAFPTQMAQTSNEALAPFNSTIRLVPRVWFGIIGIACMGLVQSMTFSFMERVGSDHGFSASAIAGVLIALGFVNLIPAPLAAFLERRIPPRAVLLGGPAVQFALVAMIMLSTRFESYALAASVFVAVMVFTHTFAFGAIAKLDPSGRALAGTPAMIMIGASIGPILGGSLVKFHGYQGIPVAAFFIALVSIGAFLKMTASNPKSPAAAT